MLLKTLTHSLFVLLILCLCTSAPSFAHDSNFSSLRIIRLSADQWLFEIKTPLFGLDQSMRKFNADKPDSLSKLVVGSKQYKELIVAYIKAKFDVTALKSEKGNVQKNKASKLSLGKGRIKLDDHLSTFVFEIKDMSDSNSNLNIQLPYMSHNPSQHNVLRLVDGDKNQRYILSDANGFSATDTSFFKQVAKQ